MRGDGGRSVLVLESGLDVGVFELDTRFSTECTLIIIHHVSYEFGLIVQSLVVQNEPSC